MRIVIDMRGGQVGRYTLALAEAIVVLNRSKHEIILALSDLYPDTIDPIRAVFKGLLPRENIRVCCTPRTLSECPDQEWACKVVELIHVAFLVSLKPDCVLMNILVGDKGLPTLRFDKLPPKLPTIALIDFFDSRLEECNTKKIHDLRQIEQLKRADYVFIRHPFDAKTAAEELGLAASSVRILSTATDEVLISAIENDAKDLVACVLSQLTETPTFSQPFVRPRLAYVSPLPPERSGIADYSAELLPFLSRFYMIDVVVDQTKVTSDPRLNHCNVLSMAEFEKNGHEYDRILYHFGNNPMHVKSCELIQQFPGVVVLHDFFLSGLQWYREAMGLVKDCLWKELYTAHGYKAAQERSHEHDEPVTFRYPCNFSALQNALGVIVHSESALLLAKKWYGLENEFTVIPLLRHPAEAINRKLAREQLGFCESDFIVCSFGFIGKTKQNHRLLNAWENSVLLSGDACCKLVYVGEAPECLYSSELTEGIRNYRKSGTIEVSGWVDANTYRLYLEAADLAVQLRTLSRGETSASVLDCMNYGIATIVNANGSMADLPDEVVQKIPDEFTDSELTDALELLYKDRERRIDLGQRAYLYVRTVNVPELCAERYAQSIEGFYKFNAYNLTHLIKNLAGALPSTVNDQQLAELANSLAYNFPGKRPARTLFLDVSVVARDDFKTGIQRTVRGLTLALIDSPPEGFRIEPVFLSNEHGQWDYYYARDYTLKLLNSACGWIGNEKIEAQPGDVLLGVDLSGGYVINAYREGVYQDLMRRGIKVSFVVYDLIPVQFQGVYPPGFEVGHAEWLRIVANMDSAICISKSIAGEYAEWVAENVPDRAKQFDIRWFHLGADLGTSSPSRGLPESADIVLRKIKGAQSFLMVGTVEPRKGHKAVLRAFDTLWAANQNVNLVITGKKGWMVDDLVDELYQHPEYGKRIFWLESISDEFLDKVYSASTCLIAASYWEGFGLPLIEAARYKLPIIARDLPVFHEVAGDYAFYFPNDDSPIVLGEAINRWLGLFAEGKHPKSDKMPWLTWKQSAQQLMDGLIDPEICQ